MYVCSQAASRYISRTIFNRVDFLGTAGERGEKRRKKDLSRSAVAESNNTV